MKILLVCKGEYRYSFPAVARTLKALFGCEVVAMTFTTPTARMMEQSGAFHEVHNLAAHLKGFVRHHEADECLQALERTEFAEMLNRMVYADRILVRYPFERVVKMMAGVLDFWEKLLVRIQPNTILSEVACATEWIGYSLARSLNITYLVPCITPVTNRVFFTRSPEGGWEAAGELYNELKRRDLNSEETKTAEEFLQVFRTRNTRHRCLKWDLRSPLDLDLDQLRKRLVRVPFRIHTCWEDGYFEIGSFDGVPPWEPVLHDLLRVVRHVYAEQFVFTRRIPNGRTLYFPLHMQPEYTTDVRAPFFTNQLALIESIAKAAPIGSRLLVKDHPAMRGIRNLSYYRTLRSLYNVDLLSPAVDSHSLISGSDVNLTITGTTAWESILYERPVIAFGPLFYGYFDLIYPCRNVADLPELIPGVIRNFRPDRRLLLKFIWSFLATAPNFQWGSTIRYPGVIEKGNLEQIAKAMFLDSKSRVAPQTDEISVTT